MKRLFFFALAGGTGFVVDAAVLFVLLKLTRLDPFTARVLAIATAMGCTYLLNRSLTFGPSGRSIAAEGTRYGGVGLASAALNYVIYAGLLLVLPMTPPLAALTVASILATAFSYVGYSRFVFGR